MLSYIKSKLEEQDSEHTPCIKQSVYVMIETKCGTEIFGSNKMLNTEIRECPRDLQGYVSGAGYHLCKEICNQNAHAEVDAINTAKEMGIDLTDSKLSLFGHTYCCDNCVSNMISNGITKVDIFDGSDNIVETIQL
jgi:deoxycytidylate deaminase